MVRTPQGSDIRSCLKLPHAAHLLLALYTCSAHMLVNIRSTHCTLAATSTAAKGRGRDHSVRGGCVDTQCCEPQCEKSHSGARRAMWTYNLRPTGTSQPCWDLVTYAH